jgi:hypothetical protein
VQKSCGRRECGRQKARFTEREEVGGKQSQRQQVGPALSSFSLRALGNGVCFKLEA